MNSDLELNGQDLIVNIQCDEPFLERKHFEKIISSSKAHSGISTLACLSNRMSYLNRILLK